MNYYSLNKKSPNTSFSEAVIRGLASDKGLYFPENITPLPKSFFENIESISNSEIAFEAIKQFVVPDIPEKELKKIIEETLSFDFPIVTLNNQVSTLELFHGPTMAFKDVGARFMARCLGYFNQKNTREVTVLVATSGDTGGAVASGFLGVKGVKVVILYPSGKVSDIQEKQLTTLGQNIKALEVNGVFDDCQEMVKKAFVDDELTSKMQLTSANSINVARWLPQMFYFLFAYKELKSKHKNIVFSIPSGNFGNICAGMVAQKLGMPVAHFVASNNLNNSVTQYLETKVYEPKASVQTISNAMDVGNPSNFIRIQEIYKHSFKTLKKNLSSYSFTDYETREAILELYNDFKYIADPHGAVGYLALENYLTYHPTATGIILETAHPAKFQEEMDRILPQPTTIPSRLADLSNLKKQAIFTPNNYEGFKELILDQFG